MASVHDFITAVAASALLCGCAAKKPTQIVVRVDSDLKVEADHAGYVSLVVPLVSTENFEARTIRSDQSGGKKVANAQTQIRRSDGAQVHQNKQVGCESASGTMRIARR